MNIHPIFVHFPIALLTVYCLLEFMRFRKMLVNKTFFYIKLFLLVIGTLGAYVALQTGEIVQESIKGEGSSLVHTHSAFANATTWIFSILAVCYLIAWLNIDFHQKTSTIIEKMNFGKLWDILSGISKLISQSNLVILYALIGLALVTITGALGGAIVYGPDVDPFVHFIYNLVK